MLQQISCGKNNRQFERKIQEITMTGTLYGLGIGPGDSGTADLKSSTSDSEKTEVIAVSRRVNAPGDRCL